MTKQVEKTQEVACLIDADRTKQLFSGRFDGCRCHKAFPDQMQTYLGNCDGDGALVVCVPEGDVRFPSESYKGMYIIAVVCENVSADYLEYLEDSNISYIFAGKDSQNINTIVRRLENDFGIKQVIL